MNRKRSRALNRVHADPAPENLQGARGRPFGALSLQTPWWRILVRKLRTVRPHGTTRAIGVRAVTDPNAERQQESAADDVVEVVAPQP